MASTPRPTIRLNDKEVNLEDSSEITVERAKEVLAATKEKAEECEEKLSETVVMNGNVLPLTKEEELRLAREQHDVPNGTELTVAHVKAILSKTNLKIDGFNKATRCAFTTDSRQHKLPLRKKA